ncbi:MAG: type II toxin-antitoxin system VapC family toxin [Thermoprotei archaeon]
MIVDSSAVLSLFFKENFSDFVRRKVEEADEVRALDLAYYEVANAIRKRVARGEIDETDATKVFEKAVELLSSFETVKVEGVIKGAFDLALKLGLTVYDAALIAAAMSLNDLVLTVDVKLLRGVTGTEAETYFVRLPDI